MSRTNSLIRDEKCHFSSIPDGGGVQQPTPSGVDENEYVLYSLFRNRIC